VRAVLSAPVTTSKGRVLTSGTPVEATVVSAAPAGTMQSAGVLSLQLIRVGSVAVVSDVAEFSGHEGHTDVADSAPVKGTEATVQPGTVLTFHVTDNGVVTGLDLRDAERARDEGTVGAPRPVTPASTAPATGPAQARTQAKGSVPPR
jgi:hypothetical protein